MQSIHFDSTKFTPAQAKAWLAQHKHAPVLFEKAVSESTKLAPGTQTTIRPHAQARQAQAQGDHTISEAGQQEATTKTEEQLKFEVTIPLKVDVDLAESELPLEQQKRECVLNLFRGGQGNEVDDCWYTDEAVTDTIELAKARRKMFFDHDKAKGTRSVRDWASTILEAWKDADPETGLLRNMGKAKVHDLELWRRIREAPNEMAISIRGTGVGVAGVGPDGKKHKRIIEKVKRLESFDWVVYPGNSAMGAQIVESETGSDDVATEITVEETTLKEANEQQFRTERKDLVAAIESQYGEELAKARAQESAIAEKDKAIDAKDVEIAAMKEQAKKDKAAIDEANKSLDGMKVTEAKRGKETLVDAKLKEADLPEYAVTDLFKSRLAECADESAIDAEIADQKAIVENGKPKEKTVTGAGPAKVAESKKVDVSEEKKAVYEALGIQDKGEEQASA